MESDDPEHWLDHNVFWGGVMRRLRKHRDDPDYVALIVPYLD